MSSDFCMMSPGTIKGVRLWNVMPGNPTIRVGLFLSGVESVAQTRDHAAVPVSVTDPIDLDFAAPYVVATMADLMWQRWNTINMFSIVVIDTSLNWYQANAGGGKSIVPSYWGSQGRCLYLSGYDFRFNMGGGWCFPTSTSCPSQGMDPIILPDLGDGYEPTPWPYFHGYAHPTVELVDPGKFLGRTTGGQFFVKRTGCLIHGVRFYTHDPNPWVAKCCIYKAPGAAALAMNTINCPKAGVYDCLFVKPLEIDNAIMKEQNIGAALVATVYNLTNGKYTKTTTAPFPMSSLMPYEFDIHRVSPINGRARRYVVGDALPVGDSVSDVYPVSPLVSRGV
jgi:hypothetical protein